MLSSSCPCFLQAFRIKWLAPYLDRLLRLADNKTLRAELTAFPLAPTPTSGVLWFGDAAQPLCYSCSANIQACRYTSQSAVQNCDNSGANACYLR